MFKIINNQLGKKNKIVYSDRGSEYFGNTINSQHKVFATQLQGCGVGAQYFMLGLQD